MEKVIFVGVNSKYIHLNTAIWYLHYSLLKSDIDSSVRSFSINEQKDKVLREILSEEATTICLSTYIWNVDYILDLVDNIKKINKNIRIILGGPEVTFDCETILRNNNIDCIMRGEGEDIVANVINYDYSYGCAYIKDDKYIDTGYAITKDLDTLPNIYTDELFEKEANKIVYYEASRGCPYNCIYCMSSTIQGIRFVSLEKVFADLDNLVSHNVSQIKFVDRTFNMDHKRTLKILEYIKNTNSQINFHLEIYPALLNDEIIEYLKTMPKGSVQIEAGIQSTNEKTLFASKRFQDNELALRNSKTIINSNNIHVHLDLICGLPYEGYDTFKKSFNDTYEIKPHVLQLGFLKILKGTQAMNLEGYEYTSKSPYEVLLTPWLSYKDITKLKLIEDCIDNYYNSHKFIKTIEYLEKQYDTPFDFYEELSKKANEEKLINVGVSEDKKYKLLFDFSKDKIVKEYLRFDYISTHKSKKIPEFLGSFGKNKQEVFTYLKEQGFDAKKEYKQINISSFKFNNSVKTYLFDYKIKDKIFNTANYKVIEL